MLTLNRQTWVQVQQVPRPGYETGHVKHVLTDHGTDVHRHHPVHFSLYRFIQMNESLFNDSFLFCICVSMSEMYI